MSSEAILVLGAQFGDEGKGKLIDIVAAERDIWYVEASLVCQGNLCAGSLFCPLDIVI